MTINVAQDNADQPIILYAVSEQRTWDELEEVLKQGRALMDSAKHAWIDFIVDMTDTKSLPSIPLSDFARLSRNT